MNCPSVNRLLTCWSIFVVFQGVVPQGRLKQCCSSITFFRVNGSQICGLWPGVKGVGFGHHQFLILNHWLKSFRICVSNTMKNHAYKATDFMLHDSVICHFTIFVPKQPLDFPPLWKRS